MVDGFRWKPILRADQCGSAKEGISHFIWRFMDPHGLAQSSSLTGCSLRRGHDRYLTEPPEIHPTRLARSSSLTGCSLRCGHDHYLMEPPEIHPTRPALLGI
ncbi:hypothetical protein CK203_098941 [Vitis vinifera]|uniref:Uncharacterized protein n=1 Tax=Vitis vinifera TaxID=29760 RepID=A0A438CV58_VITVI|nr:hypothetical protein CK203_098941 [Vitis vinifera]